MLVASMVSCLIASTSRTTGKTASKGAEALVARVGDTATSFFLFSMRRSRGLGGIVPTYSLAAIRKATRKARRFGAAADPAVLVIQIVGT